MNTFNKIIDDLSTENRFGYYAPFFRVFICLYLIKDIIVTYRFTDLLYTGKSFLVSEPLPLLEYFNISSDILRDNFYIFLLLYIALIVLFLFGIGKRFTALTLFFCVELMQNMAWLTLNGGDNIIKFVILYFVFIDSYSRFSNKPISYKNEESKKLGNFLSNVAGYSICIHLCLIYFVSAMHKINSEVWFNGVATYYILGSERFRGTGLNLALIKNGFFVTLSTYGTILIELIFPFWIWFKKTRNVMIILAISLHMGIGLFMMLYDFQIIFVLLQGFFLTNKEWQTIVSKTMNFVSRYKLRLNAIIKTNPATSK